MPMCPLELLCFDILADSDLSHLGPAFDELEPAARSAYLEEQARRCAPLLKALIDSELPKLEPIEDWRKRVKSF